MRVRPVDRVAQQRDQFCLWCDLPQPLWCQWVIERVRCRFACNSVRRQLCRKLSEIPITATFVAVRNEMKLLGCGSSHLGMCTQIGMQRRRTAALRADDDKIWRRNHSVTGAWDV